MNAKPITKITTRYDLDSTTAVQVVTVPDEGGKQASSYASRITVTIDASGYPAAVQPEPETVLVARIPVINDMETILKGLHEASLTEMGSASANPENPLAYLFA